MITHLIAFLAGCITVVLWRAIRRKTPAGDSIVLPGREDMPSDDELDAAILEYISSNRVYHINDLCQALHHPKGARHVRGHFHKLMEQGRIKYQDMTYTT
ncbi:MAG: hypothetical protein HS122_14550 [Opitutaceae bacterium]|nr:hypothetical protein [Opitutaceae bacterium]